MKSPILASAVATVSCLSGGLLLGAGLGMLVASLPFHGPLATLALIPALIGILGGGAVWGLLLSRIHSFPNRTAAAIVGGLCYGPAVIAAALLLEQLRRLLIDQHRLAGQPVHVVFTILFVPMMFLVATVGASGMLLAGGRRANWLRSALIAGLAAGLAFLIMDLALDALGMRVGAPRAAERFTMLTVAFLSSSAGAFSAGAVLGRVLAGPRGERAGRSR
jgi:hypothetical protein